MGKRLSVRRDARDVLDEACERIWMELRTLLPRYRYLRELGSARTTEQARELVDLAVRMTSLKSRSLRYRDVLRDEAWARYFEEHTL